MIKVNIVTEVCIREAVHPRLKGLPPESLRNLQSLSPDPLPPELEDIEYWPENVVPPTFNPDTHKQGSEILTAVIPTKEVDVDHDVDALDAGELADVLAARKPPKLELLRAEGLRRIQVAMPAITNWEALDLVREQFLSIAPAARQATANLQLVIDVYQAGKSAAADINAMTNVVTIDDYNVTSDPGWPV